MGDKMRMMEMKRYLIPILLAILVLTSVTSVGCSSKNAIREYLNDVIPLCEDYTRTMELVSGKGMSDISVEAQAQWLERWRSYLVLLKANIESIERPEHADYFHWLAVDSIDKAIVGVWKLADAYKEAAVSYSDKPDLEKFRSGSIDVDAALMLWRRATTELDKLVEMVNN